MSLALERGAFNRVSIDNSSTSVLNSGATFTGNAEDVYPYNAITVAVKTDQDGTLYVEFSPDGTNWDSSLAFSVTAGTITVRQSTTTANIFLSVVAGRNQSNCSAYTIPAGYTGYMRSLHSACGTSANVAVEGSIWTRSFGGVFRSRRPFFISDSYRLSDDIYGGLIFTEKSDLIIRINSVSANNTPVNAGYDLLLIKN